MNGGFEFNCISMNAMANEGFDVRTMGAGVWILDKHFGGVRLDIISHTHTRIPCPRHCVHSK